ncbi:MAG: S4 domain-containing protein YaaA [Bacillota bacterium]
MDKTITFSGEYITLGQLLKMEQLVESGGQVKLFLAETEIKVNGEPEDRRGRKLHHGDLVDITGYGRLRLE